jgi:trk system potassium uptake protein TrkA
MQTVIIVGCGRLGSMLANRLSSLGKDVVVVDPDEDAFKSLSTAFSGFRITGDAAELTVLRRAGIEGADCLLATTHNDNVNLMVAQVARTIFNVPVVIARVYDPAREAIYGQFEVDTICTTTLTAERFVSVLQSSPDGGQT